MHKQILSADPELTLSGGPRPQSAARHGIPRQLPADVPDFTGRGAETSALLAHLTHARGAADITIVAITGPGGIGKTSLAVHLAHRLASHFPDGQLFVGLGGASRRFPSADILARLLRDLGVPNSEIPSADDERAARYRTAMADRKMLLVLDDAYSSAQVRPLLPGSGGSVVLVTSRGTLADLAGARLAPLPSLNLAESRALFDAIVGPDRPGSAASTDAEAVDDILAACGGLPLAIRIAASRLASQPSWTTHQLSQLLAREQHRLGELSVGDTAVRACFEVSYIALPAGDPDPATMFRLYGLAGLRTLSMPALAALCGACVDATERAVNVLTDTHLLESPQPDHFQAHDLLRLYAAERANTDESDSSRRAAIRRLLSWYLHTLHACLQVQDNLLNRQVSLEPLAESVPVPAIVGASQAVEWLERESGNLLQAVTVAFDWGMHGTCTQLAALLRFYFNWRGQFTEYIAAAGTGLAAAEISGDRAITAELFIGLGLARRALGQLEAATLCYERARAIRHELGDSAGEARILNNMGLVEIEAGKIDPAIGFFTQALVVHRKFGWHDGEGSCLHNLGWAHEKAGRADEALMHYERALTIRQRYAPLNLQTATMHSIGELLLTMDRVDEAMSRLHEVLKVCQDNGLRYGEGLTLASLGEGYRKLGDLPQARLMWQQAHTVLRELGATEASAIQDRLRET